MYNRVCIEQAASHPPLEAHVEVLQERLLLRIDWINAYEFIFIYKFHANLHLRNRSIVFFLDQRTTQLDIILQWIGTGNEWTKE